MNYQSLKCWEWQEQQNNQLIVDDCDEGGVVKGFQKHARFFTNHSTRLSSFPPSWSMSIGLPRRRSLSCTWPLASRGWPISAWTQTDADEGFSTEYLRGRRSADRGLSNIAHEPPDTRRWDSGKGNTACKSHFRYRNLPLRCLRRQGDRGGYKGEVGLRQNSAITPLNNPPNPNSCLNEGNSPAAACLLSRLVKEPAPQAKGMALGNP